MGSSFSGKNEESNKTCHRVILVKLTEVRKTVNCKVLKNIIFVFLEIKLLWKTRNLALNAAMNKKASWKLSIIMQI